METSRPDAIPIRLLGPVELSTAAEALGGPKRHLLFAALALRPGRVVPLGELAGAVWSDDAPGDVSRSLQVHVSKLRTAIASAGLDATLAHRSGGYVLEADPEAVDVTWFHRLTARGEAEVEDDPEQARSTLAEALALWRGEPFGGLGQDTTLRSETARLADLRRRAGQQRIAADLATGRHREVVAELHQLTEEHPLSEPLWEQLVVALYRTGRQAEALAAYERARRVLAEELGADPSRSLQQLHGRVLRQDPSLEAYRPSNGRTAGDRVGRDDGGLDPRWVAVLPFEVLGGADHAALLAAGLHTDLISQLSRLRGVTVIGRGSVLGYADAETPLRQVAAELGAGTIVTGSLQAAGSRFRLTVSLLDGSRGAQRWVESYDDELTVDNLFAVQTDLARDIAASLSAELETIGPGDRRDGVTGDLDAYRLAAAGRQEFDLKTADGFVRSIACYQEATRRDPSFAAAWIGLADALASAHLYGHGERHDLLPRAERALHRAISLAPDSAEARTSLAVLAIAHQDGTTARRELERARRTRPNHADAANWHSWLALLTGDAAGGLERAEHAAAIDPRSAEPHAHIALGLAATGRPELGLEAARTARRLSPYATAALYEALCLHELDRPAEAREILTPLVEDGSRGLGWTDGGAAALLALTTGQLGDVARALSLAATIDAHRWPFAAGLALVGAGELDSAAEAFDRVEQLTPWGCLLVHHYLGRTWARGRLVPSHERLVRVALRSWDLDP